MSLQSLAKLPLSADEGWPDLVRFHPGILKVLLLLVLPFSLLPPVMLYFAGTHYPEAFGPAAHQRDWAAVAAVFLVAELATYALMGWLIRQVGNTNGLAIDLFTAMGAAVNALPGGEIVPAMDRGLLDGAEFNNATSDRLLGFPDVSKVCMLQSYHQSAETFEITFNKTKYDALPAKMKSIIAYAVEASSADMYWKAIDRYSKDYIELQTKDKVKFYKTPDAVLQTQLKLWDAIVAKKSAENALFKEIVESQKAFAERAVKWDQDTNISRRMAMNHFFGAPAAAPKKA
jgi:hypothetical protein